MELKKQRPASYPEPRPIDPLRETALGLVSTRSFPALVGTADMMLKSAGVTLVGYEKIGSGYCTAIVRGKIADVRIAVEAGADTAEQFGQLVSKLVIPRPLPNLDAIFPIGSRLCELAQGHSPSPFSNQAVGLLETRGFPAMVGAADAMLKAADVQLAAYETIGDGLCTAIIRGSVADVAVAVEAGMYEAERIGEFSTLMVIPRPLEDLERTLPLASCWSEQRQPVLMPLSVKEKQAEPELIKLPDLKQLPTNSKSEKELIELPDFKQLPNRQELL
ncbi:MAG: BMC domain-containing protein [Oscillatoriaceae bacterium SKW80]|nr:BMC domain-containing protein [Oscillatoriaceae bacterium SKYG93]MCX8119591.1 BMC domain-containing protein [Oscillatoriaceae bacterium SKW80]MDW8455058.1 BMC domain-containing protein [Oscillatoriaceae cyanobacterium SKYGB_i_bin93]HIK28165.1 BMC domain-containing protein [Oscillatoriaceae cyanobacterium M7585_C2015_266]